MDSVPHNMSILKNSASRFEFSFNVNASFPARYRSIPTQCNVDSFA